MNNFKIATRLSIGQLYTCRIAVALLLISAIFSIFGKLGLAISMVVVAKWTNDYLSNSVAVVAILYCINRLCLFRCFFLCCVYAYVYSDAFFCVVFVQMFIPRQALSHALHRAQPRQLSSI